VIAKESENLAGSSRPIPASLSIDLPRLLVVEWESETRDAMSAAAGNCGFQVASCPTAREAVKLCEVNRFDAIIVDSALYGMACVEFLRWLRGEAECKETYVLATTQNASVVETQALLAAGADDCLSKPMSGEALAARLVVMEHARKRKGQLERDESVLRKNHARFESIFMESPDAILILKNREGKIIGVNRAVKTVMGFDGKSLLGKYLSLIFPELFNGEGLSTFGSFLKNANSLQSLAFKSPDGTKKTLELSLNSIPWDRGFALMLNCRDVSDRQIETVKVGIGSGKVDAMRRLAAGVAGDVNDLMTSINGNLELLEHQPFLNQESRELLEGARQSCESVRKLTGELNAVSGIRTISKKHRISVRTLMEKTVQFGLFGESMIRPLFRFQDGLRDFAGDEKSLRYVIEQLTSNAVESMKIKSQTAGKLYVDCSNLQISGEGPHGLKPGNYVRVIFRDEGEGIPEENRERVFDPYFTTRRNGRGMGLTQVNALVSAHGGRISVETPSGNAAGAVIEIHLPAAEPGATEAVGFIPGATAETKKVGNGKRILFLDDEPNIRLIVERALSGHGYEVFCASTGEEAIKAHKRAADFGKPFDMLLLDLEIRGGLGGADALGIIRENFPNVRAVVTTGFVDDSVLANHRDFGFCGVLMKPFRVDQLVACVGQLCQVGQR
jgi:two-component system cell cycle sensor histidine kinase/response regulator CckA